MVGPGNRFHLYKDVPTNWDAWDIDSMTEQLPVTIDEPVALEVVASGPLVAKLHLSRQLHQSRLEQVISLRRGSRRIEFETTVDWQESHKLLKVSFPVNIYANEAIHEIQFGHLRRPNHRSRPFDADRFEVSNHKWSALAEENRGAAVLNDCKYGLSVLGNSINLTLLKSALAPDMTADKGLQNFTYALYTWNGSLADSNVVREAYELNCPVTLAPGAAQETSLFSLDAPNIILETVKPAEDGSPDLILRLYESKRMATSCALTTAFPLQAALQTDMLENQMSALACKDRQVVMDFRPFEIKTIRLKLSK
jgi:alpha-mannosidase